MPVQEFLFTVDPRTDKNLSSINEQLRSLTNREDPLTLDNFISFDVIGYSGLRSVVIRVTMEVNAFYARTTFPVNGAAFSQTAAPQTIKLVFNSKVDEGSITGTSIKYNGTNVAASNITLESDGYTLSVNTSGLSYNALQTHTIELISLKDKKGNGLSKQDVFSYVVGTSGSATSDRGNPEPYTYHDKVGDFKVTSFVIDRYAKIADKITEYLKTNNIDRESVIAQDILNVNEHTLEVYILYFSDLFPSVIRTFPQEGALVSSDGVPTEAVITFSQPTHVNITEANNITIGGVDISANAVLSDDKKTVKVGIGSISAGNYFIKINNIYNELGRVRSNPPIAIGFTAADIADNGGTGTGGGGGTGTPAISGIVLDVGTQIDGVNNPLITLGGDPFITSSGVSASEIALVFDETQINHANIQGGNFTAPGNISPAVTNQFISSITFNTHGHVASVTRHSVTPATETDPIFSAHIASDITNTDTTNWTAAYTHSQISAANPHGVSIGNINGGTFANLDAAITDADIAKSGDNISNFVNNVPYLTAHPTINPSASSTNNTNPTFIQNLTFDSNGHVITVSSVPITPPVIGALDASNVSGPGVIVSTGTDSGVTTTSTVNDFVSGSVISGVNVSGTVTIVPGGTAEMVIIGLEPTITAGATTEYYRGDKSFQTLNVAAVDGLQTALDAKAPSTHSHLIGDLPTKDEDNLASDSDQHLPTQQSVKAYVDGKVQTDVPAGAVFTDTVYTAFNTDFAAKTTDNLSEGSTNLYYTDARARLVSIENVVEDTTPQLGGNLDANGNDIDMGTNIISDTKVGQWDTAYGWGDHSASGYLSGDTSTGLGNSDTVVPTQNAVKVYVDSNSNIYTNTDVDTHLNQSNPTNGYVLSWTAGDYAWVEDSDTIYTLPAADGATLGGVKDGGDVTISAGVITVSDDSHSHIISNIDGLQSILDATSGTLTGHTGNTGTHFTQSQIDIPMSQINDAGGLATLDSVNGDTIDNNSVGLTELLDLTPSSVIGRISAGSGDPEVLTAAQVRTLINVEDGATADQSDAEIKTAYENNADTNAFTNSEKTKLSNITITQAVDLDTIETDVTNINSHTANTGIHFTQSQISIPLSQITDNGALAALSTVGTTQIDDDSVTFDKMQNISADRVIGRRTDGGNPTELDAADIRALINIAAGTTQIEDGATADQTAGEIKTAYESNADTNAFTDAEQTKLSNITVASSVNLDDMRSDIDENSGIITSHSGNTSNPHSVGFAQLTDLTLSTPTKGDIYYGASPSTFANLAIGSAGSFLKASASNAPSWADITFTDIDISSFSPGDILYIDNNTSVTGEASGSSNNGKFLQQGSDGYPVWTAVEGGGGGATTFSDLDNVNASVDEGTVTAGSLFYYNGTTWAALDPPNSVDHLLISTGAGTNMPYWTGAIERLTGVWLNSSELSQIGDVSTTGKNHGDLLVYDTGLAAYTNSYYVNTSFQTPLKAHSFIYPGAGSTTAPGYIGVVSEDDNTTGSWWSFGNTNSSEQSFYSDVYSPGFVSIIKSLDFYVRGGKDNSPNFPIYDFSGIFSVYPIEINGGTHTTGNVVAEFTSEVSVFNSTNTFIEFDSPVTGGNLYFQFVLEKLFTTGAVSFWPASATYAAHRHLNNAQYVFNYERAGITAVPGGSTANFKHDTPGNNLIDMQDIYLDKNTTIDQTVSSSIILATNKTLTLDYTTAAGSVAINKTILVNHVDDEIDTATSALYTTLNNEKVGTSDFTSHTSDSTIHFTEASIDHTAITNIGTNTHAQIDTHIADGTVHFTEASITHQNIAGAGTNTHAQIDTHIADSTIHFTEGSIDHTAISNIGSNTHAQIDTHISSTANPHATDIGNLGGGTLSELNSAVTDATLDDSSASRPPNGSAGGDLGGTYPNPTVNDGADGTAIHDNVNSEISALTEKATPVSADLIIIEDSAASNAKKKVQIGNLPSGGGGGGSTDLSPAEAFAWFVS